MADLANLSEDDLAHLNLDQLLSIRELINTRMDTLLDEEQERANQVKKQEQERVDLLRTKVHGSVVKKPSSKKTRTPAERVYVNPDNHRQFWNGKGDQLDWVKEKLAAGYTLDDLLNPKKK